MSAILSTASGTLLAPASVLTENVLRIFLQRLKLTDAAMLLTLRTLLILVAIVVLRWPLALVLGVMAPASIAVAWYRAR